MKTDKEIQEIQKEIQKDLENVFGGFKGKTNTESNRKVLTNQANEYLLSILGTNLFTYKSSGDKCKVNLDLCYKGKNILTDGDMGLMKCVNKCLLYDTYDLRGLE